ncbi:MAG: AMP-binding protein [Bacteroidota bacterium]
MNSHNIYKVFARASSLYPQHIALIHKQETLTYKGLQELVEEKAQVLIENGVQRGDRILIFIPMSIELYAFLLALFKIGASAVFVDQWNRRKRLHACLQNVPCQGFIASRKILYALSVFSPLIRKIPIKVSTHVRPSAQKSVEMCSVSPEEVALITFTTGSTSIPKAAKRTHAFLLAQFQVLKEEMKTRPSDIDMIGLPVVILCNLGVGASTVIPNYNLAKLGNIPHEKLYKQIQIHRVNRLIHSPFFISSFAEYVEKKAKDTSVIQQVMTGGAPVFPQDIRCFQKGFPQAKFSIFYGSTESEPISMVSGDTLLGQEGDLREKGLCVGEISSQIQLRIIPLGKDVLRFESPEIFERYTELDGEVGEIVVQGSHVLKEYVNNSEAQLIHKIPVGGQIWHRTGDVGRMIGNTLYLLGRVKHASFKEGELISPFIYEYLLSQEPGINRATVLLQEKVTAYVQAKATDLQSALKELLLASYPKIERVVMVKEFPLDPRHHSKIDYSVLKEKYG